MALPTPNPKDRHDPKTETPKLTPDETVFILEGYRKEAVDNRKSGPNPRDEQWRKNLDLYWNRYDFSAKASWQATEVLPEVPGFVDTFAASLKEALNSSPSGFYSIVDDTDTESDLAGFVKNMTDVWLGRIGKNQSGHIMDFSGVFEEQMKLGAMMACCASVTWKTDVSHGRVAMESFDPRRLWLDHTNRNLYRVRRIEIDRHELVAMSKEEDNKGKPLFNLEEIALVMDDVRAEIETEMQALHGHGHQTSSVRKPVILDEYLATVLNSSGEVDSERDSLIVVANEKRLIRGPEKNPFSHGKDWMLYAPLITTPLSPYGRTYMEDFGSVAHAFNELTNLMLDAVYVTSMNAFAVVPSLLRDPSQLATGITPMKAFFLEDGVRPQDFWKSIELGNLPPEAFTFWRSLKDELREAAKQNEIALGQFAPKGRTSATEINRTQQSTSAMIRSIANTVETRFLNPGLDLIWKTGIQHVKKDDPAMRAAVGQANLDVILKHRNELIKRPITFAARGISDLIQKGQKMQALMQVLQIVGASEALAQVFFQKISPDRLIDIMLDLMGLDKSRMLSTERESLIRDVAEAAAARAAEVQGGAPASAAAEQQGGELASLTNALGGQRGG